MGAGAGSVAEVKRAGVAVVQARSAGALCWMGAGAGCVADVTRAGVAVVRARGAGVPGWWMGAGAGCVADVKRAGVAVVRAGAPVLFVLAGPATAATCRP